MREILPESKIDISAIKSIESFHKQTLDEVKNTVAAHPIVIIGMSQNPLVKKARKKLEERGIAYKYLGYGSYFKMWKPRLAIKLWSGWPTFPQIFFSGKLIGGCKELEAALNSPNNYPELKSLK